MADSQPQAEPQAPPDEPAPPPLPEPIDLPDGGYVYVRDAAGLADCIAALEGCSVIGVDTESDSFFSYQESCCLIQVTGNGTIDYIIDPLVIDDLSSLGPLMADPNIVKIFHGADYDVVSMKRDFGFTFVNIFDTMISAQATGHDRFGLNDLVQRYFGRKLDKKWQRHDWSSRPLLDVQMDYARLDSHFLPVLREILLEQAAECGRLAMMEEEFTLLEAKSWNGKSFDPDSCMKIKGSNKFDDDQRRVLRAVVSLRDAISKHKNRPPFKVWGNDICMKLGHAKPTTQADLRKALGDTNHVIRRYGRDVLEAVQAGVADTSAPPQPPKPVQKINHLIPPFNRDDEALLVALKNWRNNLCKVEKIGPGMIVNNALLKELAALKPKDTDQLDRLPDMRIWQRKEYGTTIVEFITGWIAKHPQSGERSERKSGRRRGRGRRGGKPAPEGGAAPEAGGEAGEDS